MTSASSPSTQSSVEEAASGPMAGPVAPTSNALATLSPLPLDLIRLDVAGFIGVWQRRNAEATLPHCVANLESSGNLANLRGVAGASRASFTGMWFADSDVYKTLEGAAWQLGRDEDADLRAFVESTGELLAAAQDEDGYLNSWFQLVHPEERWTDLRSGHELYCAGHLIQAAVAAVRSGVDGEIVSVASRFADLLVEKFGPAGEAGVCGHPEVETALVELFRVTGRRDYLDLASRMTELRGHGLLAASTTGTGLAGGSFGPQYFQDHLPIRDARTATGHAVRQLYLEAGVVDVAVETRDEELLAASERIWDDLYSTKTYVTGAHGSRHRGEAIGDAYELPPDRAYGETCAAIASFHWNWRLLLATGRHRYADAMERALYNAIASGTSADGQHFFYSNPLQLRAGHDGSDEDAPSHRLSWYQCACCPPNLGRLLASIHGYVATADTSGVQLHLHAAGVIAVDVPGISARLRVRTDYPWDGRVEVTVQEAECAAPWTISLRLPGWCTGFQAPPDAELQNGYLQIQRMWRPGESIVLELSMPARLITAHPHVDAVRGCVALARGPLVYCLEQADLGSAVAVDDVRLDSSVDPTFSVVDDLLDVPVVIHARGTVERTDPSEALYSDRPRPAATEQHDIQLTAIPYFRWANREAGAMRVWIPVAATS